MDILDRAETKLRYRFKALPEARAHLREVQGRALFFYRNRKLRPLTGAPVCLELLFQDREPSRILHGVALAQAQGMGSWLELFDTRPLRELLPLQSVRRSARMGCDVLVEVRAAGLTAAGRMLDVSAGGARIRGVDGFGENEQVEVRLLSEDRLTFRDLSAGFVAWTARGEIGVSFDRLDPISRRAVTQLVSRNEREWRDCVFSGHPRGCCGPMGLNGPELPSVLPPQAGSAQA